MANFKLYTLRPLRDIIEKQSEKILYGVEHEYLFLYVSLRGEFSSVDSINSK